MPLTCAQTLTTLISFDGTDGASTFTGLVQGTDGNFYGTTTFGGTGSFGTVFKVTPNGKLITLHDFACSQTACPHGDYPYAGLTQGTDGNFYGTTSDGGSGSCPPQFGCGTVFKITPSGKLTTIHSFKGADGAIPYSRLVQATDGHFYGTTFEGGASGDGTVFKITPGGSLTTILSFDQADGAVEPSAGLVQGTDGNFYGTTYSENGTVFKITPSGTLTVLYSFICSQSGCPNGVFPNATLVQGADGNFYGTTWLGGANQLCNAGGSLQGCGTVFKITPSGTLTTLYSFCSQSGCTDGSLPYAAPVQATSGSFYGTTYLGGSYGVGTVFNLSVGLGPFVETLPTSGKVGVAVTILGTNLTGATSVTFNGTAASFKVVSSSEITTTVPSGATTGIVKVVTPKETLSSNIPFRVP